MFILAMTSWRDLGRLMGFFFWVWSVCGMKVAAPRLIWHILTLHNFPAATPEVLYFRIIWEDYHKWWFQRNFLDCSDIKQLIFLWPILLLFSYLLLKRFSIKILYAFLVLRRAKCESQCNRVDVTLLTIIYYVTGINDEVLRYVLFSAVYLLHSLFRGWNTFPRPLVFKRLIPVYMISSQIRSPRSTTIQNDS
jgi:hypothetical protein